MASNIISMAMSLGKLFKRLIGRARKALPSVHVRTWGSDPSGPNNTSAVIKAIGLAKLATRPAPATIIFLHYHPSEFFAPGYIQLIQSAQACGYRVLVVSSARPSRAKKHLGDFECVYIQRENIGYDFGALRDARESLAKHGLLTDTRYVIINSSLINIASKGFGHDPILDRLAEPENDIDLLGVTSSFEQRTYHIQSYFYSFSARLFCSSDLDNYLKRYWLGLSVQQSKMKARDYAIKNGELGLCSFVLKNGYSATSLFEHLHLPCTDTFAAMESLRMDIQDNISKKCFPDSLPGSWAGSIHPSFMTEWWSKPGLQANMSQACWALLLLNRFMFIKRELLENYQPHNHCHARSACSMLMPVLRSLEVEIPSWSDLHVLNRLVFASRP
ncbi:hypothetical protein KBY96_07130 [Cyanobium sp. ATX 6A2]|uniref:rhamnan synthesis F family protein n=1 Tax=Cyanobium sp. ATX 6A2 TaxID=2823700 RepID=UPI0020CCAF07|nr:rhamnan synthesis F family protein [Cyanobium sp. ATX 6A2]MCP9887704.1 hypothetical protein [Cyanobium sp. ATX 6A2]